MADDGALVNASETFEDMLRRIIREEVVKALDARAIGLPMRIGPWTDGPWTGGPWTDGVPLSGRAGGTVSTCPICGLQNCNEIHVTTR